MSRAGRGSFGGWRGYFWSASDRRAGLGVVGGDEAVKGVDGDFDDAVDVVILGAVKTGSFALLVPDNVEDGAGADAAGCADDEERRGFHFGCFGAHALPVFPLREQVGGDRGGAGGVLAVEGVLALDDAEVVVEGEGGGGFQEFGVGAREVEGADDGFRGPVERLGRVGEGPGDREVGDGGEFEAGIFEGGAFGTDGAGRDDGVAGADVEVDAAAGADTNEGVGAEADELFDGDGRGGAADAGGADGNFLAAAGAGPDFKFALHAEFDGIFKVGGDGGATAWVANKNDIFADGVKRGFGREMEGLGGVD